MLTDQDIAWAAGLFEGEGCITTSGGTKRVRYLVVALGMTDHPVVERFAALMTVGRLTRNRPPSWKDHWKTATYWHATGKEALSALELLLPYLGDRRHEQLAKALDSCATSRVAEKQLSLDMNDVAATRPVTDTDSGERCHVAP